MTVGSGALSLIIGFLYLLFESLFSAEISWIPKLFRHNKMIMQGKSFFSFIDSSVDNFCSNIGRIKNCFNKKSGKIGEKADISGEIYVISGNFPIFATKFSLPGNGIGKEKKQTLGLTGFDSG